MIDSGAVGDVVHRARGDDVPAVLPGAGADVDDPVGGAHRLLVVLDDDQGVADVAQPLQGADQPGVVALVEADARLVEDVEHAHQAGADLGGQPDALRLAAGEGVGGALERQVVESDVDQEAEPLPDLLEDLAGDQELALASAAPSGARPGRAPACANQSCASRIGIRVTSTIERPSTVTARTLRLEPRALAGRAGARRHVALQISSRT